MTAQKPYDEYSPMYEMDEDGEMVLVKEPQPPYDPELDEANYDKDGHYLLSPKYYPQWNSPTLPPT